MDVYIQEEAISLNSFKLCYKYKTRQIYFAAFDPPGIPKTFPLRPVDPVC